MSPFEEEVLWGALEAVTAWRVLHDPKTSGEIDSEAMLGLMRAAGYSEPAAQKAATQRGFERVRHDLPL